MAGRQRRAIGVTAARALLDEVARGAYRLEPIAPADIAAAATIMERFADLEVGLADASIPVLAERHACHDLLTLDDRHFRVLPGPGGKPFDSCRPIADAVLRSRTHGHRGKLHGRGESDVSRRPLARSENP